VLALTAIRFVSSINLDLYLIESIKLELGINPLSPSDAVRKQEKNILEDLFSSVLSQFKKYQPSRNLKLNI